MNKERIIRLYLDYVNNFISVDNWREYHNLTKLESNYILKKGKRLCK